LPAKSTQENDQACEIELGLFDQMSSFQEDTYLREKIRALIFGLISRLDEFVEEFPSDESSKLITAIKVFLVQVEAQLPETSNVELLRWSCRLIDELSEVLEWLDHAHTAQTPRAYVNILTEISENMLDGAAILVTPTAESNYRISDEVPRLEKLTNALSESAQELVLAGLPDALYRIRFPRIERENILNHALFGHEFGHPIADEFFEDLEAKSEYQERLKNAQNEIAKEPEIAGQLAQLPDDTDRARLMSEIAETLSQIHKRALVELMSDAVAVYLFGPSAIFSAMDFFIRESLDEIPEFDEYYPPTRFRWRVMLEILESEGQLEGLRSLQFSSFQTGIEKAMQTTLAYLQETVSKTTDQEVLRSDPYTRVAYAWLDQTLPEALIYARKRAQPMLYNAALIQEEVPLLLERLQAEVPPSEVGIWPNVRAVDWRSTIVASWLLAMSQTLDESLKLEQRQKAVRTTHNLALKGVEYIYLQREYIAHLKARDAAA
jgi:hypothetical protein